MSEPLFASKQTIDILIRKVAAHTRIPRKHLVPEFLTRQGLEEPTSVFQLRALDDIADRLTYFYCVKITDSAINLLDWMRPEKWTKSKYYTAYLEGMDYANVGEYSYAMVAHIKGHVWVFRQIVEAEDTYGGIIAGGGQPSKLGAIIIEPISNFLEMRAPCND